MSLFLDAGEDSPKMLSVNTIDVLTANWACDKCGFTLSELGMRELHKETFDKLRALVGGDAELYQKFIDENLSPCGVLHPTHEAIIEAKREIVLKDIELETSKCCSSLYCVRYTVCIHLFICHTETHRKCLQIYATLSDLS